MALHAACNSLFGMQGKLHGQQQPVLILYCNGYFGLVCFSVPALGGVADLFAFLFLLD
jgi:hypothetical protein